ncbi:hypothetical protein Ancab_024926 [Ancistrocladus abbreviatus]
MVSYHKLLKGRTIDVMVLVGWVRANLDSYNCIYKGKTPIIDSPDEDTKSSASRGMGIYIVTEEIEQRRREVGSYSSIEPRQRTQIMEIGGLLASGDFGDRHHRRRMEEQDPK